MNKREELDLQTLLPILYFAGRILLFFALTPNDFHGFGDFPIYFDVANLQGLPFINYWVEYPPLFAFTTEFIFILASGNQFLFDFILYIVITLCNAASVWLFFEISKKVKINDQQKAIINIAYFGFLAFISYTWWYFDPVPVMLMLLTILLIIKRKDNFAGFALALGILTKWFPLLILPAVFRHSSWKKALRILIIGILATFSVWAVFYFIAPTMTSASLSSQPSRSSWQTIWALIDNNLTTGEFIPLQERVWPEAAVFPRGNPATISTFVTLLLFGGIGLFFLVFRYKNQSIEGFLAMIGITWALFLLWSPGWSPQWILYLIPIILLTLPANRGWLLSFILSLITFIEWPFLLKHNLWMGLWLIVPLRIGMFVYLIVVWNKIISKQISQENQTN